MTVQFSTAVRNAMLDAIETGMGPSVKLQGYTGAMPANCAAAATGIKLTENVLAADWAAAASAGAKALSSLPLTTTAITGGALGYYRFVDSAGTTCHEQGTITATGGGGDMTVDNPVLTTSQTVNVTAFSKTAPGA